MSKYRKKPVVIEALQWDGNNLTEIEEFCGTARQEFTCLNPGAGLSVPTGRLIIPTLEGDHLATERDFSIRGVKGEFYPCKPDIFEATYESVE